MKRYNLIPICHPPEHDGATGYFTVREEEHAEGKYVRYEDALAEMRQASASTARQVETWPSERRLHESEEGE